MPRSHEQLIEIVESELLEALRILDNNSLRNLVHPEIVYIDEKGNSYEGFEQLQVLDPKRLLIDKIEILERSINFFNDISIVYVLETRSGIVNEIPFKSIYRITRIWKFINGKWMLISVSIVEL